MSFLLLMLACLATIGVTRSLRKRGRLGARMVPTPTVECPYCDSQKGLAYCPRCGQRLAAPRAIVLLLIYIVFSAFGGVLPIYDQAGAEPLTTARTLADGNMGTPVSSDAVMPGDLIKFWMVHADKKAHGHAGLTKSVVRDINQRIRAHFRLPRVSRRDRC